MNIVDIKKELEIFNKINFNEEKHIYSIDEYVFPISSTGWLKKFTEPFNEDYWAQYKANERGITKEEMILEWRENSRISTDEIGSPLHKYLELSHLNKKDEFVKNNNLNLDKLLKMVDEFLDISKDGLIPITSELVLGDRSINIAGMVDQLFINTKTNLIELWDWKSSKKIEVKSYGNKKMKIPFHRFDDCNFYHYSLQLNLYKYIIEKYTNLKISKMRICQFSILNEKYKIYDCIDMQNELKIHFTN